MPPIVTSRATRLPQATAVNRQDLLRVAPTLACHTAALAILLWSETDLVPKLAFLLSWGVFNFFFLVLLRRPALSAVLSLLLFTGLIVISRFKFMVLWMTANFLDLMFI